MADHITRYDKMPIPPIEAHTEYFPAGNVRIGVEFRVLNDVAVAAIRATLEGAQGGETGRLEIKGDEVAAIDKEYPGIALARGLLFEKSGDVQKALDQFSGALQKQPNDIKILAANRQAGLEQQPRYVGVASFERGAQRGAEYLGRQVFVLRKQLPRRVVEPELGREDEPANRVRVIFELFVGIRRERGPAHAAHRRRSVSKLVEHVVNPLASGLVRELVGPKQEIDGCISVDARVGDSAEVATAHHVLAIRAVGPRRHVGVVGTAPVAAGQRQHQRVAGQQPTVRAGAQVQHIVPGGEGGAQVVPGGSSPSAAPRRRWRP